MLSSAQIIAWLGIAWLARLLVPEIHPRRSERWLMITYLESRGREIYAATA
jgi:hypothetical protein